MPRSNSRFFNQVLLVITLFGWEKSYSQFSCTNWLNTPSRYSFVDVGNLNVTGNQITVEATINRTQPYVAGGGDNTEGDVVSKHDNPNDVNYLLRPNECSITTSNGFFMTPVVSTVNLNKTYHVAMVYDGKTLKFFRDGCLIAQVPASGNLVQNNWHTRIGYYQNQIYNTNFIGYINEVRIWKVARTQDQIRAYMNSSLPSPSTQVGLLAYYTFDNLINKQGNPAWNGTLNGSALINQTNPACAPVPDLCAPVNTDSIIVNKYTAVTDFDVCKNELIVSNASNFKVGDTVLLIQMKGADIDTSNTASFGNIINYNSAGNFEFNVIKEKNANKMILLNTLNRKYNIPSGKVQLVRVPFFDNLNNTAVITCLPWDGEKGGVIAFNVKGTFTMGADVDASGKGFRHGAALNSTLVTMNEQDYFYDPSVNKGAAKGEGITTVSTGKDYGRGALANGGGGGNAHNCGGGGGGNGGAGGSGGDQWQTGKTIAENVGGKGGKALNNSSTLNKLFFGGSGGMGQGNDLREYPAGNGGGIVIFSANTVANSTYKIKSNGGNATEAPNSAECKDGMAGGGAAGTISLDAPTILGQLNVEAKGGKGADHIATNVLHGPGGGGAGGVVCLQQPTVSAQYTINVSGGKNGVNVYHGNDPYGATPGTDGIILKSFDQLTDRIPFKQNIDSIRFISNLHDCRTVDFTPLAYFNNSPITGWNWHFGDGGTSTAKNVSHDYAFGNFDAKLIAEDINGCRDSFHVPVAVKDITLTVKKDTALCGPGSVHLSASGGIVYSWLPSASLSNTAIPDPVASPSVSTKYFVTALDARGCSRSDSVNVVVNELPVVSKSNDTSICKNTSVPLFAGGGNVYQWSPASSLDRSDIAQPIASPSANTVYVVKVTNGNGCTKTDSVKITLNPVANISASSDTTICKNGNATLFATGGNSYQWMPAASLNNASVARPVATPTTTTTYIVEVKDQFRCTYHDSVTVAVRPQPAFAVSPSQSVCAKQPAQLTASGGDTYTWTPAAFLSAGNVDNPIATPDSSITYSVLITDNICRASATLESKITVLARPEVRASSSNNISCTAASAHLLASGADQYTWSPAASLDFANNSNPTATPKTTTVYTVIGTDNHGCANKDSVTVNVHFDGNVFYGLPNSFTPNGDGLNDCFGVSKWAAVTQLELSVYNRFGQRIFYTTNPSICWDGTFQGKDQKPDVYVYTIRATMPCGKIDTKGTIMLVR